MTAEERLAGIEVAQRQYRPRTGKNMYFACYDRIKTDDIDTNGACGNYQFDAMNCIYCGAGKRSYIYMGGPKKRDPRFMIDSYANWKEDYE